MAHPVRLFATSDIGDAALARLRARGLEVEVYEALEPPPYELVLQRVESGIAALVTTLRDRVDERLLAAGAASGLRVVAQIAVGVDNIDRAAANRHHIPFTNTPDVLTEATADYAFALLLAVARRTWEAERMVRENTWRTWHPSQPWLGEDVSGRTLAVIGLGRIGRGVVHRAVGFDMDVVCHSRRPADPAFLDGVRRVMAARRDAGFTRRGQRIEDVGLDEALERADFVSLHVALSRPGESDAPTWHLLDARRLRLMKRSAFLVNTSRGPVVDEGALVDALREGALAGAALDVFEREPLPADSPLRDPALEPRLRLFPHHASATTRTRLSADPDEGMAGRTVQAVLDVLEGSYDGDPSRMPYVVNKEAFVPVTPGARP
jgi:glyoxylate reductase